MNESHIAANGSLEVGQELSVVLKGDAADLVIRDNPRRVGRHPFASLLASWRNAGSPAFRCWI